MELEKFVQNVKFYCKRKGEKPTVACRNAGVGNSFINNMELKGSVPSVEKVQLLAHYLGCTVSELLGETGACRNQVQPPGIATLHDSAVRVGSEDACRLTISEVQLVMSYRRADERTRTMVQLALEPFGNSEQLGKREAGGSAG